MKSTHLNYVWKKDLATGIAEIDNEHMKLFSIFNRLATSSRDEKRIEGVISTIIFLEEYTISHFSREERSMLNHKYAGYRRHKVQHDEFLKQISIFRESYEKEGATALYSLSLLNSLMDWLTDHIHVMDKEMAVFLREQKKKQVDN